MWGFMEDESEGTGEEEIALRPEVILVRSSRRVNSADFPSRISPLKVHSGAAAGAIQRPISSGEFGLWRGSSLETLRGGSVWPGSVRGATSRLFPGRIWKNLRWGIAAPPQSPTFS